MNRRSAGRIAEQLAAEYLVKRGCTVLERNRRIAGVEVDIVAADGRTLVFVEVKKRTTLERAAYAVSETQKRRIRSGAEAFLKKHPQFNNCDIRFDAVLVKFPFSFRHIKNAW